MPPGGRRRHDGGGARQAHRPARHRVRDARPRRHQRLARHSHRETGFDPADHVRRAGRARDARPRGVPGARLSRGVRHHGEMGDRDRRSGAHPRDRLACVSCGDERAPGAGGDRAPGGHADGARLGRRCARRGHDRDLARPHRHVASAEDAVGRRAADRDPRRQPLVGSGVRRGRALCRAVRHAGRHLVPPHAAVSGDASLLRRRSRHGRQSEAGRAREGGRPPAARRRPHGGNAEPGLHAARHSQSEDEARSTSIRTRTSWVTSTGPTLRSMPRRPRSRLRSKGCSRRTRSAGAPGPRRRARITSPGPSNRPSSRAR